MLRQLIRFLRGYVVFTLRGRFPERFVNLSVRRGNPFLYINPKGEEFEGAMLLCDYKNVRPLARRCSVKLRVKKRIGLPFLLLKYRRRKGLLAGFVVFLILSIVMRNFVWSVEIEGVNTLSESALIAELEDNSLYVGAPLFSIDEVTCEHRLMQKNTDIGWMSLNILGTKAQVEIKEKVRKPEIVDYKTPCNIVAGSDGLITEMNTKQGSARIKAGSAVVKGQLLVSGAMVNALEEIDYVHSAARVLAETERKENFFVFCEVSYKSPSAELIRHRGLFLFMDFPLDFTSADKENTVRFETKKVFINNTLLPLGMEKEYITEYKEITARIDEEKARKILETEDMLYRLFSLSNTEETKAHRRFVNTPNGYELKVTYNCLEDIAKEQKIIVN